MPKEAPQAEADNPQLRQAQGAGNQAFSFGKSRARMFTGDRLAVAKRVGRSVGVDAIEAECLPDLSEEHWFEVRDWSHNGRWLVGNRALKTGQVLA